jgi:hypothetical protein
MLVMALRYDALSVLKQQAPTTKNNEEMTHRKRGSLTP